MAGPKIFIAHTVLIFQQNLTTLVRKDKIRCSGVLCVVIESSDETLHLSGMGASGSHHGPWLGHPDTWLTGVQWLQMTIRAEIAEVRGIRLSRNARELKEIVKKKDFSEIIVRKDCMHPNSHQNDCAHHPDEPMPHCRHHWSGNRELRGVPNACRSGHSYPVRSTSRTARDIGSLGCDPAWDRAPKDQPCNWDQSTWLWMLSDPP